MQVDGHHNRGNALFYWHCGPDIRHRAVHHASQVPHAWAKLLRDNYEVILHELRSGDYPLVGFDSLDDGNAYLNQHGEWRALPLLMYGRPSQVSRHLPRTMALLAQTPLHNAYVSFLGGGAWLPPHRGSTQFLLRYHLGLDVPAVGPLPQVVC